MSFKKIGIAIVALGVVVAGLIAVPFVTERVDAGCYKIVQKMNGDLVVLDKPGWH